MVQKFLYIAHHTVPFSWYTQSILKSNEHRNMATTAFSHRHTEALLNESKMEICKKHQATDVSG